MKILQVNKFWYPKGGADVYCLAVTRALEEMGHEVARFGMEHPENEESPWNQYFVSLSDYDSDRATPKAACKFIHNKEAKRKFEQLIEDFEPDVIHFHNIYHQLSTSILPVARRSGAHTVMTLHDYKLISPNYTMYADGQVTEATKRHKYYKLLSSKTSDESLPRRVLLMLEAYYTWITGKYSRNIDSFIAPSEFMKLLVKQYGVKQDIDLLLNFIDVQPEGNPIPQSQREPFVLFVGRLSPEKGIQTLLKAAAQLPEKRFVIIGEGEEKPERWPQNVEWLGRQPQEVVLDYLRRAQALIMPSEWYEVNTLVIPEAHAMGTWVIAANTGTIELLYHGKNGWWFEPGNVAQLVQRIEQLDELEETFRPFLHITKQDHMQMLESIYVRGITPATTPVYTSTVEAAQISEA